MSRIIVKNLPKHATEARLRDHFSAFGEVTDCRLKATADGQSRNFAFIGFKQEAEAQEAIKRLNRSFLDTTRIAVEPAYAPGSEQLGRAWSRYSKDSSKYAKEHGEDPRRAKGSAEAATEAGEVKPPKAEGAAKTLEEVKAAKLSKAAKGETGDEPAPAPAAERKDDAFDEDLDDLAYLQKKAKPAAAVEETEKGKKKKKKKLAKDEDGDAAGTKKKKKVAKKKKAGGDAEADAAKEEEPKAAEEEDGADASGRVYVTNIPYGTREEELRSHFGRLGEVSVVNVCKDEDTLKSRGFAYVTYVFTENAIRAVADLDGQPFQGRMLRVAEARAKPEPKAPDDAVTGKSGKSSYKKQLKERQKKVDAHLEHTWNLLYVSASSAADAASSQLGVAKSDLFGKDAENQALTAALTETSIIQQTKRWLQKEGIRIDAFEQTGTSLQKSKAVVVEGGKRRDDTFIVKHLPAGSSAQELRERFARAGDLVRCSLAPSGTVAIVQYVDKYQASRAFQKIAFSRYRHVPLYLEWAPDDVFTEERQPAAAAAAPDGEAAGGAAGSTAAAETKLAGEEQDEGDQSGRGCLFVKNLSFASTDEALRSAFSGSRGFKSATVMRKKSAVDGDKAGKDGKDQGLSMGYGFVEFDSLESAQDALRRRQGVVVDGHALNLAISQRAAGRKGSAAAKPGKKAAGPLKSSRLCVRNLAFEVQRRELYQLFGAYGSVSAVRLPKKADYSGHRGFAFVDLASKAEAAAAYEALQHTHLYGRRLVIEPAEETATDVGAVAEATQKRKAAKETASSAKKRRKQGVLEAPGDSTAFADAML